MSYNNNYRNSRFKIEIDGIIQAGFSEATNLESTTEVIEYREGTDPTTMRKTAGLTKYGNFTLKWGIADSMELYNWYKDIVDGKINTSRKTIHIRLLKEQGLDDFAASWTFINAWPTKYDPGDFNAKNNEIFIEVLEIAHEGMIRE